MPDDNQQDEQEAQTRACPVCGATVDPDDRYCRNCGASIASVSEPVFSGPQPGVPSDAPTEKLEEIDFSESTSLAAGQEPLLHGPVAQAGDHGFSNRDAFVRSGDRSPRSRTWLIVLLIVVLILVVCCCLMLVAFSIAAADTSFQEEVGAAVQGWLVA